MLLNVYHEVYESFPKLEQRFCRWIFVEKKKYSITIKLLHSLYLKIKKKKKKETKTAKFWQIFYILSWFLVEKKSIFK